MNVIRLMAAEGITKQDIMAIRPILRTWIGGGWTDGPQLARLLAKHEQTLAKFKPQKPVKLWRNERIPGPGGFTGPALNNHGAEDQYTRPTAWSAEKMAAETYAIGAGRRLVTALVPPEDIYVSIPVVDYWCRKLGLKPIDEHGQSECIVKPNPSFLASIRRPVARQDEQGLRKELEDAMLAAYLPELAKAQAEGRKVIYEADLRERIAGAARDTHAEDLPEKIREWQGRKVASAFRYGVTAAFTYSPKRNWKDYILVTLDVDKVEASWSKDRDFYVGPGGTGAAIGKRYARFQQWLDENPETPIDPPMIGLTPSRSIIFGDGRHRFAVLRDLGEKRIAALVPREDLKDMEARFGAQRVSGHSVAARAEQWPTDEFKQWFAGSKIVDAQGNPLPVYHGSTRGGISQSTVQSSFFTPNKAVATTYSKDDYTGSHGARPVVQAFYLRITNPLEVDAQGAPWMRIPFEGNVYTTNDLAALAKRKGHDGLIIRNVEDNVNDEELAPADVIVTLGGRAQIKSAEENSGAFSREDNRVTAKVASKTLYHGTTATRAKKIMAEGLEPQVGSLVQRAYGDDEDYDFEPLAFAADKSGINRGVYSAMLHAIEAEGHDTTNREEAIRNHGAIVVLKDGEDVMEHRPGGDDEFGYTDYPLQVEPGDYFSREGVVPDYVITGPALVRFFKRNGGDFLHRGLNPKKVNALIGWAKAAHPDVPVEKIVEKVWGLDFNGFQKAWDYYRALPTSKAASLTAQWEPPSFEQMQWSGTTPKLYEAAVKRLKALEFPLTLYRAVKIPDESALWTDRAGIYWTDQLDRARFYTPAGKTAPGGKFVLRTQVQAHQIDWDSTFHANCERQGHTGTREQEIKLHAGTPLVINAILSPEATEFEPRSIRVTASAPTMGFNVNDSERPWTQMILQGIKTVETRNSDSLRPYVGKRVGIIRTGVGRATLVGYCDLGEPKVYRTNEEFRADQKAHQVPQGSGYDIPPGGVKFGYPVTNVEAVQPREITSRGNVWRRIAAAPHTVYHGTSSSKPPTRQNGILWAAPDQHMALNYASTYWRQGTPTLWAIKLNPTARIADLRDLNNPVIRQIKEQVAAERKMSFGVGISDESWPSFADFGLLETRRWILDELKKARVDAVWVHDVDGMTGGARKDSLAILTDKAIHAVTKVVPAVPRELATV